MTLTQLKYLIAVDTHRHFAKAAEKCLVTQPTLSIQIQKLEEELQLVLFDRTKHPVVPTQEGLPIIEQARKVLAEAQKIKGLAQNVGAEISGMLRIAVLPSLAPYLLPLFIRSFAKKYPKLHIEVVELHNYQLIGRLKQDRADVALTVAPLAIDGFYQIPLFQEPIAVYLDADHPLAADQEINVNDLVISDLLLTDDAKSMLLAVAELQNEKVQKTAEDKVSNLFYRSGSVETIRKIIEQEGGITLLPQLATFYMGKRQQQFVRHFKAPEPTRQIILLTQRGFHKQRLLDILQAEIQEAVAKALLMEK